jgi:hypothetical protein
MILFADDAGDVERISTSATPIDPSALVLSGQPGADILESANLLSGRAIECFPFYIDKYTFGRIGKSGGKFYWFIDYEWWSWHW